MATYSPRFGVLPSEDNTARTLEYAYEEVAYAATKAIAPNAWETTYMFAQLTGVVSITATLTSAKVGDTLKFLFNSDASARVVTFSTGFSPTASKRATAVFIFDGVSFVEQSRAVSA
jgi:hypothetical protein